MLSCSVSNVQLPAYISEKGFVCACSRLSLVHRFSDDQVDCLCEALLQQYPGSRSRLMTLISSLSASQLQRPDSEHLLRARAVVAFHAGRFTELYTILSGSHVFKPAHHPLLQKVYSVPFLFFYSPTPHHETSCTI